jgi:hypothetical protein
MKSRRFSLSFLILLASLAASYLTCAVVINPRGYFNVNIFPVVTLDSRQAKMKLFASFNISRPVDGLILGSSRAMKISGSELTNQLGQRFFNFSVDSAEAEDYLAIYRWVRSQDPRLKTLVIALDVEALHDDDQLDGRLKSNADLMRVLGDRGQRPPLCTELQDALDRLKEVFSRHYATDMAQSILLHVGSGVTPLVTFDVDGFLHYLAWERPSTLSLHARVAASREEYDRRFRSMTSLSNKRRDLLEQLLQDAGHNGITVVLWITPIHPDLADYLSRETRYALLLEETRAYVMYLGSKYGVTTYDFSSPALFGGTNSGWYDGAHIDSTNATVIALKLSDGLKLHGL